MEALVAVIVLNYNVCLLGCKSFVIAPQFAAARRVVGVVETAVELFVQPLHQ